MRSLASNDTLYAHDGQKLLLPASNMKIVTLAVAADTLGWDFAFETRLLANGTIRGGVLDGDLVVVGSGDPSIDDWDGAATKLFREWAETLKARGIRTVTGRIVGDDNSFDDDGLGRGWAWDDLGASFATSIGALQYNENTAQVSISPGPGIGELANITIGPPGTSLAVRNLVITSGIDQPSTLAIRRPPGTVPLEIRGTIPITAGRQLRNVSVDNPTLYFVNALRQALVANGIDVRGRAVDIDDLTDPPLRDRCTLLVSHRSPSLSELAQTMMRLSQNLYAETLLRVLGSTDRPGSAAAGTQVIGATLQVWGIGPTDVVIEDGSGLTRYDLATADALAAVLAHVYREERLRGPFEASLPVAGRDGTMAQHMKGTAAEGNARIKTGSFSNARAFSGYVRAIDGEPLVFSIIANNYGPAADAVEDTIDAIVTRLASFKR